MNTTELLKKSAAITDVVNMQKINLEAANCSASQIEVKSMVWMQQMESLCPEKWEYSHVGNMGILAAAAARSEINESMNEELKIDVCTNKNNIQGINNDMLRLYSVCLDHTYVNAAPTDMKQLLRTNENPDRSFVEYERKTQTSLPAAVDSQTFQASGSHAHIGPSATIGPHWSVQSMNRQGESPSQDEDTQSAISSMSRNTNQDCDPGEETETALEVEAEDDTQTRCICSMNHNDDYMICCDKCFVWQHVDCMDISRNNIPDIYYCEKCDSRPVDKQRARRIQSSKDIVIGPMTENITTGDGFVTRRMDNAPPHDIRHVLRAERKPHSAQQVPNTNIYNSNATRLIIAKETIDDIEAAILVPSYLNNPPKSSIVAPTQRGRSNVRRARGRGRGRGSTVLNSSIGGIQDEGFNGGGGSDSTIESGITPMRALRGTRRYPRRRNNKFQQCDLNQIEPDLSDNEPSLNRYSDSSHQFSHASVNHYSPELRACIGDILKQPEVMQRILFTEHESLLKLTVNLQSKATVVPHAGGQILVSQDNLTPNQPVIELRGKFMLHTQFRAQNPGLFMNSPQPNTQTALFKVNRRTPGRFIFFLQIPPINEDINTNDMEICIDTRHYGNDARYSRRSCRPNAKLQYVLDNGCLRVFVVAMQNIRASTEISIAHEPHDLLALQKKKSNNMIIIPTSMPCACGLSRDCIFGPQVNALPSESQNISATNDTHNSVVLFQDNQHNNVVTPLSIPTTVNVNPGMTLQQLSDCCWPQVQQEKNLAHVDLQPTVIQSPEISSGTELPGNVCNDALVSTEQNNQIQTQQEQQISTTLSMQKNAVHKIDAATCNAGELEHKIELSNIRARGGRGRGGNTYRISTRDSARCTRKNSKSSSRGQEHIVTQEVVPHVGDRELRKLQATLRRFEMIDKEFQTKYLKMVRSGQISLEEVREIFKKENKNPTPNYWESMEKAQRKFQEGAKKAAAVKTAANMETKQLFGGRKPTRKRRAAATKSRRRNIVKRNQPEQQQREGVFNFVKQFKTEKQDKDKQDTIRDVVTVAPKKELEDQSQDEKLGVVPKNEIMDVDQVIQAVKKEDPMPSFNLSNACLLVDAVVRSTEPPSTETMPPLTPESPSQTLHERTITNTTKCIKTKRVLMSNWFNEERAEAAAAAAAATTAACIPVPSIKNRLHFESTSKNVDLSFLSILPSTHQNLLSPLHAIVSPEYYPGSHVYPTPSPPSSPLQSKPASLSVKPSQEKPKIKTVPLNIERAVNLAKMAPVFPHTFNMVRPGVKGHVMRRNTITEEPQNLCMKFDWVAYQAQKQYEHSVVERNDESLMPAPPLTPDSLKESNSLNCKPIIHRAPFLLPEACPSAPLPVPGPKPAAVPISCQTRRNTMVDTPLDKTQSAKKRWLIKSQNDFQTNLYTPSKNFDTPVSAIATSITFAGTSAINTYPDTTVVPTTSTVTVTNSQGPINDLDLMPHYTLITKKSDTTTNTNYVDDDATTSAAATLLMMHASAISNFERSVNNTETCQNNEMTATSLPLAKSSNMETPKKAITAPLKKRRLVIKDANVIEDTNNVVQRNISPTSSLDIPSTLNKARAYACNKACLKTEEATSTDDPAVELNQIPVTGTSIETATVEQFEPEDGYVDILRTPSPGPRFEAEVNMVKIEPEDTNCTEDVKIDVECMSITHNSMTTTTTTKMTSNENTKVGESKIQKQKIERKRDSSMTITINTTTNTIVPTILPASPIVAPTAHTKRCNTKKKRQNADEEQDLDGSEQSVKEKKGKKDKEKSTKEIEREERSKLRAEKEKDKKEKKEKKKEAAENRLRRRAKSADPSSDSSRPATPEDGERYSISLMFGAENDPRRTVITVRTLKKPDKSKSQKELEQPSEISQEHAAVAAAEAVLEGPSTSRAAAEAHAMLDPATQPSDENTTTEQTLHAAPETENEVVKKLLHGSRPRNCVQPQRRNTVCGEPVLNIKKESFIFGSMNNEASSVTSTLPLPALVSTSNSSLATFTVTTKKETETNETNFIVPSVPKFDKIQNTRNALQAAKAAAKLKIKIRSYEEAQQKLQQQARLLEVRNQTRLLALKTTSVSEEVQNTSENEASEKQTAAKLLEYERRERDRETMRLERERLEKQRELVAEVKVKKEKEIKADTEVQKVKRKSQGHSESIEKKRRADPEIQPLENQDKSNSNEHLQKKDEVKTEKWETKEIGVIPQEQIKNAEATSKSDNKNISETNINVEMKNCMSSKKKKEAVETDKRKREYHKECELTKAKKDREREREREDVRSRERERSKQRDERFSAFQSLSFNKKHRENFEAAKPFVRDAWDQRRNKNRALDLRNNRQSYRPSLDGRNGVHIRNTPHRQTIDGRAHSNSTNNWRNRRESYNNNNRRDNYNRREYRPRFLPQNMEFNEPSPSLPSLQQLQTTITRRESIAVPYGHQKRHQSNSNPFVMPFVGVPPTTNQQNNNRYNHFNEQRNNRAPVKVMAPPLHLEQVLQPSACTEAAITFLSPAPPTSARNNTMVTDKFPYSSLPTFNNSIYVPNTPPGATAIGTGNLNDSPLNSMLSARTSQSATNGTSNVQLDGMKFPLKNAEASATIDELLNRLKTTDTRPLANVYENKTTAHWSANTDPRLTRSGSPTSAESGEKFGSSGEGESLESLRKTCTKKVSLKEYRQRLQSFNSNIEDQPDDTERQSRHLDEFIESEKFVNNCDSYSIRSPTPEASYLSTEKNATTADDDKNQLFLYNKPKPHTVTLGMPERKSNLNSLLANLQSDSYSNLFGMKAFSDKPTELEKAQEKMSNRYISSRLAQKSPPTESAENTLTPTNNSFGNSTYSQMFEDVSSGSSDSNFAAPDLTKQLTIPKETKTQITPKRALPETKKHKKKDRKPKELTNMEEKKKKTTDIRMNKPSKLRPTKEKMTEEEKRLHAKMAMMAAAALTTSVKNDLE